jgi:imidazolonepropionase-like amidohydrolase
MGTSGESAVGQWELLADAGVPPMDVVQAATRNAAIAMRKQEELGSILPGRSADLVMLSANPLEDPRNLARVDRVMKGGEWVEK